MKGIRVVCRPGDVVLFRATVLEHLFSQIKGERSVLYGDCGEREQPRPAPQSRERISGRMGNNVLFRKLHWRRVVPSHPAGAERQGHAEGSPGGTYQPGDVVLF